MLDFVDTRYRATDGETSREAARAAVSKKAALERASIYRAIYTSESGLTAREVAIRTGIDWYETSRRISEVHGIRKTLQKRDGCAVWELVR